MIFPTIVTWVYFQWLKDSESAWQQTAYGLGKILQFGFPVVFVWLFHRERIWRTQADRKRRQPANLVAGIAPSGQLNPVRDRFWLGGRSRNVGDFFHDDSRRRW